MTPVSMRSSFRKPLGSSPCSTQPSSPLSCSAYPAPLSSQLSSPPPSSVAPSSPGGPEDTPNATMAPERTTGRGPQTARIARIKFSPYPKPDIGEALELRFARKSLRGGAGVIHPNDARDGKFLFRNSIKDLPDVAIKEAVLMKHAGRETRRYRALSSAWELREAEHYSNFMKYIYQADRKKYGEYLGDGQGDVDLDHAAEIDDAENFLAFGREAYNEDIMTFQTTNTQLDQLEEEVQCRVHDSSSEFDGSSDCDASDRYAESGVNDSKDGLMGPVDST
ncbi:hypothetical protein BKA82DRAFT_4352676 [Pisolithus tinctorius]|nr:hypothetical protein BKA82DRAFT_4352676 [Pisolithus tinctorius]